MHTRIPLIRLVALTFAFALAAALPPACAQSTLESIPEGNRDEPHAYGASIRTIIKYSHDPDNVVIQMDKVSGSILRPADRSPLLRVYGNRRVRIHAHPSANPDMPTESETKESSLQLTEDKMAELLSFLSEKGIMEFDSRAVTQEMKRVDRRLGREVTPKANTYADTVMPADAVTTTIDVHLTGYRPRGTIGSATTELHAKVSWPGIQKMVEWYPGIEALHRLAATEEELSALTRHKDGETLDVKPAAIIEYSHDPDTVVVQMEWTDGRIARLPESPPQLRVYGDGRVHIHFHWPNKARLKGYDAKTAKAKGLAPPSEGRDYSLQLSKQEMDELMSFIAEKRIMDFDSEAIKERMREIDVEMGRETLPNGKTHVEANVVDGGWSTIQVNVDVYGPSGVQRETQSNVKKEISWYCAGFSARFYPSIEALQRLSDVLEELSRLVRWAVSEGVDEE